MNAHVAASGAGRASMIHLGLGLKRSKLVFSRIKYEWHQAQSANGGGGGGGGVVLHAWTSS